MKKQALVRFSQLLIVFIFLTAGLLRPSVRPHAERLFALLDVPFLSQTALKDQDATRSLTLGNNPTVLLWQKGCGVASLAMIYRYYGVDTDVVRLNNALRESGGFVLGLLDWGNEEAFLEAGRPWIQGIEAVGTSQPRAQQERVDRELADGHPVIAFLGNQHYVVLTGKDDRGNYLINDPWSKEEVGGKGVPLEQNPTKLGFDQTTQFVFVYPDRNAPTNGIPVSGSIATKYYSVGGSRGSLGNPVASAEGLTDDKLWQRFEQGVILSSPPEVYALHGPVWETFQAAGGIAKLGMPRSDTYFYFVGPGGVEWRADFANASILWTEGDRVEEARILTAQNGLRSEYFANPDLKGSPVYERFEENLLFNWQEGSPGPWVVPDGFSARFVTTIQVGGVGWFYNFVVDADDGARLLLDDNVILDGWVDRSKLGLVRTWLSRGNHTLKVEYRDIRGEAHLLVGYSAWPVKPVFAAESAAGSFAYLPAPAPVNETVPVPEPAAGLSAESAAPLAYDVVLPGETAVLTLEMRNTGSVVWSGNAFALTSQGGDLGNAPTRLALVAPVAPAESVSWNLQVPVSGAPGVRTARYQMSYNDRPFGNAVTVYVVVLPEPLKDAEQRIRDQIEEWQRQGEQAVEEMMQRILEEIQQEIERQATNFIDEMLAQCTSASVMLSLALALVYHGRRRR
jgi:hypothetical protein